MFEMATYYSRLPQILRSVIRTVTKKSVGHNVSGIINSADRIFVPSVFELAGDAAPGDPSPAKLTASWELEKANNPQYEYYANGGAIESLSGGSYDWTRSPDWASNSLYWVFYAHNGQGFARRNMQVSESLAYYLPMFCI